MSKVFQAFMPEASADFSETDGMLSVSSVYIQGGAILEVVVNDPDVSATDIDPLLMDLLLTLMEQHTLQIKQASNGKWYVYAVDKSFNLSTLLDADDSNGMEYGFQCTTGLGVQTGLSGEHKFWQLVQKVLANIIGDTTYDHMGRSTCTGLHQQEQLSNAGSCLDINNMIGSLDDTAGTTSRQTDVCLSTTRCTIIK